VSRPEGLLKISELAERSGVSAATIKHYLREGLLGEGDAVVRTSRNMAWYPPAYVDRVRLIKQLQDERFLPLREIKAILDRALALHEGGVVAAAEAAGRFGVPQVVLDRLAELGVLTPDEEGYDADDVAIIEAIARFRAGGYDEALGFTVFDTLRYREALAPLVADEVSVLLERLAGEVTPDRAAEIIASGRQPLRELIGAMHSKMLGEELRRRRSAPGS
jgi:DNA-binding transcriptional MerR regulator